MSDVAICLDGSSYVAFPGGGTDSINGFFSTLEGGGPPIAGSYLVGALQGSALPLAHVSLGSSCAAVGWGPDRYVVLRSEDYERARHAFTGFGLADMSALLPAVALCWAVAWLFKRLLSQLR